MLYIHTPKVYRSALCSANAVKKHRCWLHGCGRPCNACSIYIPLQSYCPRLHSQSRTAHENGSPLYVEIIGCAVWLNFILITRLSSDPSHVAQLFSQHRCENTFQSGTLFNTYFIWAGAVINRFKVILAMFVRWMADSFTAQFRQFSMIKGFRCWGYAWLTLMPMSVLHELRANDKPRWISLLQQSRRALFLFVDQIAQDLKRCLISPFWPRYFSACKKGAGVWEFQAARSMCARIELLRNVHRCCIAVTIRGSKRRA